jgi:hypothetical protein
VLAAEEAPIAARLAAITKAAEAATAAWEAGAPDDGGTPGIVHEPSDLQRFGAAQVRWIGGSHFLGTPVVRVERSTADGWVTAATQDGEIQTTLEWKKTELDSAVTWASDSHTSLWTATFEVFDETRPGTYRFVVEGDHRAGRSSRPYELVSDAFEVSPWTGVAATDAVLDDAGLSFEASAVYPKTYTPVGVGYIDGGVKQFSGYDYCPRCSFRAWASEGEVVSAHVTVDGVRTPATLVNGRWVVDGVAPGASAVIEPGDLVDEYGNVNASPLLLA